MIIYATICSNDVLYTTETHDNKATCKLSCCGREKWYFPVLTMFLHHQTPDLPVGAPALILSLMLGSKKALVNK